MSENSLRFTGSCHQCGQLLVGYTKAELVNHLAQNGEHATAHHIARNGVWPDDP